MSTQELIERLRAMSYAETDELTRIAGRSREAEDDGGFENAALLYELEADAKQALDREQFFTAAADRLASLSADLDALKAKLAGVDEKAAWTVAKLIHDRTRRFGENTCWDNVRVLSDQQVLNDRARALYHDIARAAIAAYLAAVRNGE